MSEHTDNVNEYRTRPRIVTGADGLPHCSRCQGADDLCPFHRAQVKNVLDTLRSPNLLARDTDLRYIVHRKDKYAEPEPQNKREQDGSS